MEPVTEIAQLRTIHDALQLVVDELRALFPNRNLSEMQSKVDELDRRIGRLEEKVKLL